MIFSKYESYIDSKIEWLPKIPSHWNIDRTKSLFKESIEKTSTGKEVLLTVSHITGVTPRDEKNVYMFLAEDMVGYKLCKKHDLIINTMWAWMGALGFSKYEGICSPAYNVYRFRSINNHHSKYFEYLFTTPNFIMEMTRFSKGIRPSRLRLYPSYFFQIKIAFPEKKEQIEISNYLDIKKSQIDKKIECLENKIKKYEELRKTLIEKTLLDLINKDNKKRLKNTVIKLESGSRDKGGAVEEGVLSISAEHINWKGQFDLSNRKYISPEYYSKMNGGKLKLNDIILTKDGATLGKTAFISELYSKKMAINEHMFLIRISKYYYPKYIYYWFSSQFNYNEICRCAKNTGVPGINSNFLNNLFFADIDKKEQIEIANYLDKKTKIIDDIISIMNNQIDTLKEFGITLINDVVIGKVKIHDE